MISYLVLSEYERKRLDNLKENQKMLREMGIYSDLSEPVEIKKPKIVNKNSIVVRKPKAVKSIPQPLTRSKRKQTGGSSNDEDQQLIKIQNYLAATPQLESFEPISEINIDIDYVKEQQMEKTTKYDHDFEKFRTTNELVFKVVPARISAMACHRTGMDNFIAFIGDKFGNLSLFQTRCVDIVSNDDEDTYKITQFDMHNESINSIQSLSNNPSNVITASFDDTIRLFDFEKMKNILVANLKNQPWPDKLSSVRHCENNNSTLFGTSKGLIGELDFRTGDVESSERIGNRRIYNFAQSPSDVNSVCISNGNYIDLHDVRKLKKPVSTIISSSKAIPSCEFSDCTGDYIAVLGYDDFIATFSFGPSGAELIDKVYHNNNTGRWLSRFRCQWMPKSDAKFITGSIDSTRKIDVFSEDCRNVGEIGRNELNYVCSINEFHHDGKILITGSSSGKITMLKSI
ncbi:MAG: WD repeat-containing protein 76 [Marteilia pararefringens]